jgi:hypothetical protein
VDGRCGVGDEGKWCGVGMQGGDLQRAAARRPRALALEGADGAASLRRAAAQRPRAEALEMLAARRPRAAALRMQGRAWVSAKLVSGEGVLPSGGGVARRFWRGWRRWAAAVGGSGGVRGSWAAVGGSGGVHG